MKKLFYLFLIAVFGFTLCSAAGNKNNKGNKENKGKKTAKIKYENPLFNAIVKNDLQALAQILNDGADVNAKEKGDTALIVAFNEGSLRVTSILLSFGADPNIAGAEGKTALELGDKANTYENFQKYQAMQEIVKNNYKKKERMKLLVNKENNNTTVLNCDELIETKYISACREDKTNTAWKIYSNQGEYKDYVFSLKPVYVADKTYFISEENNFSIRDDRWNALKKDLKKVKPEFTENGIIFNITYDNGRKEVYNP